MLGSSMVELTNEGAAYLAALRSSNTATGGTAPAQEKALVPSANSGSSGETSPIPSGRERRRGPRYKCEGSVEIRQEGSDVHSWSAFTDISLHGTYVEAPVTHPVGTKLDLKLRLNGFQIATKGVVKVSYPYLAMGIGFTEMSDNSRTQLRQLLNSLSVTASSLPNAMPQTSVRVQSSPGTEAIAVVAELEQYFATRQLLMREDFHRMLRKARKRYPA